MKWICYGDCASSIPGMNEFVPFVQRAEMEINFGQKKKQLSWMRHVLSRTVILGIWIAVKEGPHAKCMSFGIHWTPDKYGTRQHNVLSTIWVLFEPLEHGNAIADDYPPNSVSLPVSSSSRTSPAVVNGNWTVQLFARYVYVWRPNEIVKKMSEWQVCKQIKICQYFTELSADAIRICWRYFITAVNSVGFYFRLKLTQMKT